MTKKKDKKRKFAPVLILSLLCLMVFWLFSGQLRYYGIVPEKTPSIINGWTVDVNGVKYENVNLGEFTFSGLTRLDIVDMSVEINEDMEGGKSVELLSYLCSVEAYVGDEVVYSYGLDDVWDDKMVGSGYHFIELPEKCAGEKLLVRLVINEDNAFTSITPPEYSDTGSAIVNFVDKNIVNVLIDTFLMVLGLLLTLVGLVALISNRSALRMMLIGLFSFTMGLWSFCSNSLFVIPSLDRTVMTTLEYVSLYVAPVFIGLLFWDMRREENSWRTVIVGIGTSILVDFCVVAGMLHATNSMRFPETLQWFHIVGAVGVFVLVIGGVLSVKNKNLSEQIASGAVILLLVTFVLDLSRFNIQKYVFAGSKLLQNSFIPIGSLLFVVMLLASYLSSLYDMVLTNAERDALTKLAYHDALTGLYNRAMSYDAFSAIEQKQLNVALISFDVNGLKTVNDKYGHDEGDKFLKRVAHLLERSFEDVGTCYRIGGDEFLAIVYEEKFDELQGALNKFTENLKRASEYSDYPLSTAYGIAYVTENEERSMHTTAGLADKRMYEMKATCECSRMAEEAGKKKEEAAVKEEASVEEKADATFAASEGDESINETCSGESGDGEEIASDVDDSLKSVEVKAVTA